MELLESLKLRIKNISNELLVDLIADTTTDIKTYLNYADVDVLPSGCDSIIKELVMIRANRVGSEGIASESFSGISQSYEADLPPDLKRRLNKYRRLP